MSFALGRYLAGKVTLHVPYNGVASAEVELLDARDLSGAQTLTCGDLVMQGTIVEGGIVAGRSRYSWRAGAGRWDATVKPKGYGNSNGVLLSTVIKELAAEVGEVVNVPGAARLGLPPFASYARLGGPAWHTLKILKVSWYVDAGGVTQIDDRPSSPVPTTATLVLWAREDGHRVHCPEGEQIAGWLPGNTIDGERIASTTIEMDGDGPIRISTYTRRPSASSHDYRAQLTTIIQQDTAHLRLNGTYRYVVQSREGSMYGLVPVRTDLGLPALGTAAGDNAVGVGMFPGAAGHSADLELNTVVAVAFLDGDAGAPFIVGVERLADRDPVLTPINSRFDASVRVDLGDAEQLVARETDTTRGPTFSFANVGGGVSIFITNPDGDSFSALITSTSGALTVVTDPPIPGSFETETVINPPTQRKVYA